LRRRVRSAGGVVYEATDGAGVRLLMIEDRFGHWTFPKGQIDAGETAIEAALREIREETGIVGEVEGELGTIRYVYDDGAGDKVEKEVAFYLVRRVGGRLSPRRGEVADARWVGVETARRLSGYSNTDDVLQRAVEILGRNGGDEGE